MNAAFENTLFRYVLVAGLPSAGLLLLCLWILEFSFAALTLVAAILFLKIVFIAHFLRSRLAYKVRSIASLLEAVSNGDVSLRGRPDENNKSMGGYFKGDAFSELIRQINNMADTLQSQRLEVKEQQLLVGKVINNIDIALVAVDENHTIKLVNLAFTRLFGSSAEKILGRSTDELNIADLCKADPNIPVDWNFPTRSGRFSVYRDSFIEEGTKHQLLLIKDVKVMLRTEEQQAWQKLIRVLSHELNNSLAPISSLSGSLQNLIDQPEHAELLKQNLNVIHERSNGIMRFVRGFKELSRQPSPERSEFDLQKAVSNACALFPKVNVNLIHEQGAFLYKGDQALIEQVLINLLKNAHESQCLASKSLNTVELPPLDIHICSNGDRITIKVVDSGTGISNPNNLFIPFYSTKAKGSGVGLSTSRQIIEAHGGELTLENRVNGPGCVATIVLPINVEFGAKRIK